MTFIPLSASMALMGRSELLATEDSTENQSNKVSYHQLITFRRVDHHVNLRNLFL